MSFARKFGDKDSRKLIDTATKTRIDAEKTASERNVQKTAEATGDFIGNKIADKITSIGETKEKVKINKPEEIYILPEKRQQIIDDLKLFWIIIIIIIIITNNYNNYNNHEIKYFLFFIDIVIFRASLS